MAAYEIGKSLGISLSAIYRGVKAATVPRKYGWSHPILFPFFGKALDMPRASPYNISANIVCLRLNDTLVIVLFQAQQKAARDVDELVSEISALFRHT